MEGQLPLQIRQLQRFLPWRSQVRANGKQGKCPLRRLGSRLYPVRADNPAAWLFLEVARHEVETGQADGIGLCVPEDLCVIDIDDVLHGGCLNEDILRMVERYRTWTEVSPSGTGLHLWFRNPEGLRPRRREQLELLTAGGYVTLTGTPFSDTPLRLASLPEDLVQQFSSPAKNVEVYTAALSAVVPEAVVLPQHFQAALQRSASLRRLYLDGDITEHRSRSEADLALCQLLHRWAGPDPVLIDSLFKTSALHRSKWCGSYRDRTITVALTTGHWGE
jgi:putative DNA primase/helicase